MKKDNQISSLVLNLVIYLSPLLLLAAGQALPIAKSMEMKITTISSICGAGIGCLLILLKWSFGLRNKVLKIDRVKHAHSLGMTICKCSDTGEIMSESFIDGAWRPYCKKCKRHNSVAADIKHMQIKLD